MQQWKPSTVYAQGVAVRNPAGETVLALSAHTSGTEFDASKWSTPILATKTERVSGDTDVLSQATAAGVTAADVSVARVPAGDLTTRASLTPDGRTRFVLWSGTGLGGDGGDWYQKSVPSGVTEAAGPTSPDGAPSTTLTIAAAQTADYSLINVEPKAHTPGSLVQGWVWVDDVTKISSAAVLIYSGPSASSTTWSRAVPPLRNGWNLIRIAAHSGVLTSWGQPRRLTLRVITTAPTIVAWGRFWVECPKKAQMIYTLDRGYRTAIDQMLPELRSRNIPVTWALDMALNSPDASGPHITDAEVLQFAGQGDEMSIHAYDGAVTNTMTPQQIRQDALRAQDWLLDKGLPATMFRAAYTQNLAPNASAAAPFFAAQATGEGNSSGLDTWPHIAPQNVARYTLHGKTPAQVDTIFDNMAKTHALWIPYTHGVSGAGGSNITPTELAYFLTKVDAAMSAGWLEATTYRKMLEQAGGIVR